MLVNGRRAKWLAVIPVGLVLLIFVIFAEMTENLQDQTLPWWHWSAVRFSSEDSLNVNTRPQYEVTEHNQNARESNLSRRIILNDQLFFGFGKDFHVPADLCGGNCLVTYNKSYREVADAVLFHCVDLTQSMLTPIRRHTSQLFVFMCLENPWTTKYSRRGQVSFDEVDDIFNLSMSYRQDSDISIPYLTSDALVQLLQQENQFVNFNQLLRMKSGHSIWIVSNCGYTKGAQHRMTMVSKLVYAGLRVDLFGSCFKSVTESTKELVAKYKFYLSFENSFHCRDYITEKVWHNALKSGAIPVIWGPSKSDVKKLLPPNSYIMTEDFASPKDLVIYLNFLNSNNEEYKKFFLWRFGVKHMVNMSGALNQDSLTSGFCKLCKMLHSGGLQTNKPRIVPSVNTWWYGDEQQICLAPAGVKDLVFYCISYIYLEIHHVLGFLVMFFLTVFILILFLSGRFFACRFRTGAR